MKLGHVKSYFAVHEVVVLTGFSKHMLDYLVRQEIFLPRVETRRARGVKRRYTYEDVVLLRALNAICIGKGRISHLRDSLQQFRIEFGPLKPGQRIEKMLFVHGNQLSAYTSAEGGRQLRSGQMTFAFVADLSVISKEIAECVRVEPGSGLFSLSNAMARKAEEERQRIWRPVKTRRTARP